MGEIFKPEDMDSEDKIKKEAEKLAKELDEDPEEIEKELKRRKGEEPGQGEEKE